MPEVTPLCCGSLTLDAGHLVADGRHGDVAIPSTVYLVEAEETVLVDTSFGDVALMDEYHPSYRCRRDPDQTLRAVLDAQGYDPGDVDAVVLTHLHWDHCYNLDLFPDAEVYVQRDELAYAVAPHDFHADSYDATSLGRQPPWLTRDLTALEGEREICAGVTAVPTPGHSVGHQSVAVETDEGVVVAAADAVETFENVDGESPVPGAVVDELAWAESARRLLDRADRLLPGHEWSILDADPPDGA